MMVNDAYRRLTFEQCAGGCGYARNTDILPQQHQDREGALLLRLKLEFKSEALTPTPDGRLLLTCSGRRFIHL